MKKFFNRIFLMFFTLLMILIPNLYAKNIIFQADANLNNLRWTTFVKAYSTSSSSNHTEPKILRNRTGGSAWYLTRYISLHLKDDAYYSSEPSTKQDVLVYFDDSGNNVISSSNYINYENLTHQGSTYIKKQDPGHDIKEEFYSTWSETERVEKESEYAVEESSNYGYDSNGNVDQWMRISTFRLGNSETNYVKKLIDDMYTNSPGKLDIQEINGLLYAKVRLTNVLSMDANQNMSNAYEFYYNSRDDWDYPNYGYDADGVYQKGKSALNNYDNYILIPFKEVPKNREVYVTYRILGTNDTNGILWDDAQSSQSFVDGTIINNLIDNLGYVEFDGEYWLEHYSLTPSQKNLNVKYNSNILNKTYNNGTKYNYAGMQVVSGDYDSGMLDSSHTSREVANDNSTEPIKVTFYYEPKQITGKYQYIYIKHVNKQTGAVINELKDTETFSTGFKETDLTKLSVTNAYQTAYRFKADNIANGGVYKSSRLDGNNKVTINGVEYTYNGYRKYTGSTYSEANTEVSGVKLLLKDGWWINASATTKYNVIIFYYTPKNPDEPSNADVTITGRLAFHTKYNNEKSNIEYVPSSTNNATNYLIPYIEGAKRYLLPFVNETTGVSLDDTKSYMKDYAEYRYLKIEGDSKKGNEPNIYYNEYETTGTTRNDSNQPISVSNSYTINKNNFTFGSSSNRNVNSKTLKFSNIGLNSNGTLSFTITGMEDGKVDHWYDYVLTNTVVTPAVPAGPDGTGGSEGYTTYYYTRYERCTRYNQNGTTYTETIGSSNVSYKNETKSRETLTDVTRAVPVTYYVTLKQKFRLSHLWVYLIDSTNVSVEQTGTQPRGKVYENGESFSISTTGTRTSEETGDNYIGKVREQLKRYYTNYLDTKERLPLPNKTDTLDYDASNNSKYKVKTNAYNGLRFATANITYKMYDLATNSSGSETKTRNYDINSYDVTNTNIAKTSEINENINIYTPIGILNAKVENETGGYVNHSGVEQDGVIQKNAKFTFTPVSRTLTYGDVSVNTNPYISYYKVKFDFTISNCQIINSNNKSLVRNVGTLEANTFIRLENGQSLSGTASNGTASDIVGQFTNKYKIFAIAKNCISDNFVDAQIAKDSLENYNTINSYRNAYIDVDNNDRIDNPNASRSSSNTVEPSSRNGNNTILDRNDSNMTEDSHYIVERVVNTTNLNRIYDFKITDCTDLAYKDVFRVSNSSDVNERSDTNYYSGTRYWLLNTANVNQMVDRIFENDFKTIIPLAPYKNTNTTYIFAPKLGYRFSFDLKTTGALNSSGNTLNTNTKKIVIKPSYYYISKDGTGLNTNIDLYYKNSSGKYVKFVGSGYTIQFRPNDGYRFKSNLYVTDDLSYMSNKLNNLRIANFSGFELNSNMMATTESTFVQSWYGEFKLPNSTIAVKSGDSPSESQVLTNGYIGVVFNIEAIDKVNGTQVSISYNKNDLASANTTNTTQWDYEGFLGFNQVGSELTNPLNIQLEKGIWKIDRDEDYQKIKGTVILYDTDDRAANDFN